VGYGYYKRVNPALIHLLSYPEVALVRHPFTYLMHPEVIFLIEFNSYRMCRAWKNPAGLTEFVIYKDWEV